MTSESKYEGASAARKTVPHTTDVARATEESADPRCAWCLSHPLYIRYHDEEWGVPEYDSAALFERLLLEGMQAGLSWLTVLKKRAHMRKAFFGFDQTRLAGATSAERETWLQDPGVIRHRGKLNALVANAQATLDMRVPLSEFLWSFVDGVPIQNHWRAPSEVPSTTETSHRMAKALKSHGFRFVGPTICYAFMQSAGLVNDHLASCPAHSRCAAQAT